MSFGSKTQFSSSPTSLSAGQLLRRYVLALSLIAILIVVSQVVMQLRIADQEHDSRVVNIAGRQRMLSQQIAKLSYDISNAASSEAALVFQKQLSEALNLWERSHAGLLHGDKAIGLPGNNSTEVIALFDQVQPNYEAVVAAAKAILPPSESAAALAQGIHSIRARELGFLKGMDDIVFRYDLEAKAKVEFGKWLEIGLMVATLLVLILEAAFIFAPATRRIQGDMQELILANLKMQDNNSMLTRQKAELEATLGRVKHLEGLLSICMSCKKIRTESNDWHQLERYIGEHSDAVFSHGLCPDCLQTAMKKFD